eukprot:356867-Chlamydomonas_euryale.AAC.2
MSSRYSCSSKWDVILTVPSGQGLPSLPFRAGRACHPRRACKSHCSLPPASTSEHLCHNPHPPSAPAKASDPKP